MMFALIFDLCFKCMYCIMDHIGKDQATTLMQYYDNLVLLPLLNIIIGFLNPRKFTTCSIPALSRPPSNGLYGLFHHNKFLKVFLKLNFLCFNVENANGLNPLKWCASNQLRFPNVGFLAKQILGIQSSQIKIKLIFSIVGVFTSL